MAVPEVEAALREMAPRMKPPKCMVFMNGSGVRVPEGASVHAHIIPELLKSLTHAVQWERSVREMMRVGIEDFVELGPRTQLRQIMRRIDAAAYERTTNV